MLKRMTLAAAAVALSTPAMATCLEDRNGAQCDIFLEAYRTNDVPVGTTMVWPERQFLLEDIERRNSRTGVESVVGDDVLYWDGDDAFVVRENSGAQIPIADW